MQDPSQSVDEIANRVFDYLADIFPVSCATDEFFYFPHIRKPEPIWDNWDQFTPDCINEVAQRLSSWESELEQLNQNRFGSEKRIDISHILKFSRTLREQLLDIRFWEKQPTFYLTITCLGLVEALESKDPLAIHARARTLPAFLDKSSENLKKVPQLFLDLGKKMVVDTYRFIKSLCRDIPGLKSSLEALNRFQKVLEQVSTSKTAIPPLVMVEHIYRHHIGFDTDIKETDQLLDLEISEMEQVIRQEAKKLIPGEYTGNNIYSILHRAMEQIPVIAMDKRNLVELYGNEVSGLSAHCLEQGFLSPQLVASCPVSVVPMPSYLSAIRTAASYSIPPLHPPASGTFYILNNLPTKDKKRLQRELQMLTAHETYPGHHLLDTYRLSHTGIIRRSIEQPLFYEGWACFAEELTQFTGYLANPGDRLLLAKRRLWRAIRGKIDLGLQTGIMTNTTAAEYLENSGIGKEYAYSVVRKYPLNPGYQLCYTVGLRKFIDLYKQYGQKDIKKFVNIIMEHGEIGFSDLEDIMKEKGNALSALN